MPTNHTPEFCGTDTFVDLAFNMSQKQPQLSDLKVATVIAISAIEEAHALKEKVALLELALGAARSQAAQQQAEPGADERAAFEAWFKTPEAMAAGDANGWHGISWAAWQARAAQSGQRASVADGWQVVPKKPTEEMLRMLGFPAGAGEAFYANMLAAAPTQQQEGGS